MTDRESFNPFQAGHVQETWPLLAELRTAGPVAEVAGGMKYVTRHDECQAVLRDMATKQQQEVSLNNLEAALMARKAN